MLEYARWKYIVLVVVLLLGALYSMPNLYPQDAAVQVSGNRGAVIDEALREKTQGILEAAKIPFKSIETDAERLLVRLVDDSRQMAAAEALRSGLGNEYIAALNLAPTVPGWLDAIRARPMTLGLDLQGGVHFLMQIDADTALAKQQERYADDVRTWMRDQDIRYRSVNLVNGAIVAELRSSADRDLAFTRLSRDYPIFELTEGQPTGESFPLTARLRGTEAAAELDKAVEQNISTLRSRINQLGVAEPIIQQQGAQRIVVQLPGVQDTAFAKKMLGATATLEYRAVDTTVLNAAEAIATGRVPPDSRVYYRREIGPDGKPMPVLLKKRLIVSGDELTAADATFDQNGSPAVSVTLNETGGRKMQAFTDESVGKPMAVVFVERVPVTTLVDGKEVIRSELREEVISVANINDRFGKRFQTTGLGREEASQLALLLRAGALAAPMDIIEERIVGPSLGKENIKKGFTAVLASFAFVLVFFVVYYKMFGIVTNIALLLNLLLVFACMSVFGATLTLPGLAAIVLTVGMSVDANVLINERIREELRTGNTPFASIVAGYEKASGTIWDANVTAFIAGLALFAFGSGPIKGFAVALCVGIATSLYTAVSVARGITTLIYGKRKKLAHVSI